MAKDWQIAALMLGFSGGLTFAQSVEVPVSIADGIPISAIRATVQFHSGIVEAGAMTMTMAVSALSNAGTKFIIEMRGKKDGNFLCGIYESTFPPRTGEIAFELRVREAGGGCTPDGAMIRNLNPIEKEIDRISGLSTLSGSGMPEAVVSADSGCLDDLVVSLKSRGLDVRERLTELATYGCIFTVPSITRVSLVQAAGPATMVRIEQGAKTGSIGWVPSSWVTPVKSMVTDKKAAGAETDLRK